MSLTIEVQGLRELSDKLKQLPDKLRKKVLRGAVSTAAKIVQAAAIQLAPEYTGEVSQGHAPPGTLKRAIFRKHVRDSEHDETFIVGVKSGKKFQKKNLDAFYWRFVEFGTVKMPAHPFLRPAFEANKEKAVQAIKQALAEGLDKVARE